MTEITIEKYAGKMNRAGYDAFLQAMRHARGEGNRQVELVHWLFHALSNQNADIACSLRETGIDRGAALKALDQAIARLQKNVTETPGISDKLAEGWKLERLDKTMLQILRAGAWELIARADVPTGSAISEYVDVAHAFFEKREAKFVNGVLDAVAKAVR